MKIETDFNTKITSQALEYIDRGWSCFPLSLDKRPIARWKQYQTAHPLEEEIQEWADEGAPVCDSTGSIVARDKMFNLALVTGNISGVVVVDCDNDKAVEYAKLHGLTSPVAVKTRRGMHFYFRHPNGGQRFRNKVGNNPGNSWHKCDGLDFRGDGGYVIAPPSVSLDEDGEVKHNYIWMVAEGYDISDMPMWEGKADDVETTEAFDFSKLNLSNIHINEGSLDVREQIERHCIAINRKLRGPDMGDATDNWMIKFCGQMVRRGLQGDDLSNAVIEFFEKYFEYSAPQATVERWLTSKMRSAIEMDRRNHPEDYDHDGNRIDIEVKKAEINEERGGIIVLHDTDYSRILSSLGDTLYHADPILPSRCIVQVAGYNGHGKSFFVMALTKAIAANRPNFGPYFIGKPAKVLYLDFDNPTRTVLERASGFVKMFGATGDNFGLWTPTVDRTDMSLRTDLGRENLQRLMDQEKPDIVVIDTVRNAFGGLDEKSPQDWFIVNHVAKIIRDQYKATCVLVHHRNKPNEHGLGRESGSAAQLTDLDTQVFITQVYNDKILAKQKAGVFSEDLMITRGGKAYDPFRYFAEKMSRGGKPDVDNRVKMVTEVSFGKVRNPTDLHENAYLAWTENLHTQWRDLLWTPSKREDALCMAASGKTSKQVAQELMIPATQIEQWIKARGSV